MIYHALETFGTTEYDQLNLAALESLEGWLMHNELGIWEQQVITRLRGLEVRSFNPKVSQAASACLSLAGGGFF